MRREELQSLYLELADLAITGADIAVEERLPELLKLRYEGHEVRMPEGAKEANLAALIGEIEKLGVPDSQTDNGHVSGLALLLTKVGRHKSKLGLGLIAVAAGIVLLVLFLAHNANQAPPVVRRQPAPAQSKIPQLPPKQSPKPKKGEVVHKDESQPTISVPHKGRPHQEPKRTAPWEEGLVASRTEIGKVGAVLGSPTTTDIDTMKQVSLKVGDKLYASSIVETGDADKLDLVFPDGTALSLDYNTSIRIPQNKSFAGRPEFVALVQGHVVARVTHSDDHKFAVKTHFATAEDLGTTFSLGLDRDRAVLRVKEGAVAFYNEHGRVIAGPLTETSATSGESPTKPTRIRSFVIRMPGRDLLLVVDEHEMSEAAVRNAMAYPLGYGGLEATRTLDGSIRVTRVVPGSPAERAGVANGDEALGLNGKPIADPRAVERVSYKRGSRVVLKLKRGGQVKSVRYTSAAAPFSASPSVEKLSDSAADATLLGLMANRSAAEQALERLVAKAPSASVYNNLGVLYQVDERWNDAIRSYQSATRLEPRAGLYHRNLGAALRIIGNERRGIEELRRAVEVDPTGPVTLDYLAGALLSAGSGAEAKKIADRETKLAPSATDGWLTAATAVMGSPEAIDLARHATTLEPAWSGSWTILAQAEWLAGKFEQAEIDYKRALALNPFDIHALNDYGAMLLQQSRLDEAIEVLRTLTRVAPKFVEGFNNLSGALAARGMFPEALGASNAVLALEPDNAYAHSNAGAALARLGRFDEASDHYRRAIESSPYDPGFHVGLARMYMRLKRPVDAEREYRAAILNDDKYVAAHADLADLLADSDRYKEAEAEYRKFIELAPNVTTGYNNLAYMFTRQQRWADAESLMRKVIEIKPQSALAHGNLGTALMWLGKNDESESELKKAIDLGGLPPVMLASLWDHLGFIYEQRGDTKAAVDAYRKSIQADPQNDDAQKALKRLGG